MQTCKKKLAMYIFFKSISDFRFLCIFAASFLYRILSRENIIHLQLTKKCKWNRLLYENRYFFRFFPWWIFRMWRFNAFLPEYLFWQIWQGYLIFRWTDSTWRWRISGRAKLSTHLSHWYRWPIWLTGKIGHTCKQTADFFLFCHRAIFYVKELDPLWSFGHRSPAMTLRPSFGMMNPLMFVQGFLVCILVSTEWADFLDF